MKRSLLVNLDEKAYEDLHNAMNYKIENDKGIIVFRLFEGGSKQQWYRELLSAGLQKKLMDMQAKEKEIYGEK